MTELALAYHGSLVALLALAVLIAIQFIVADIAGIRAKHIPGMPVADGHRSFLFRATRAHANTNENLPLLVLIVLIGMLAGASPRWLMIGLWVFAAARAAHMVCYYADWRLARSIAFGIGAVAQLGLLVLDALALP